MLDALQQSPPVRLSSGTGLAGTQLGCASLSSEERNALDGTALAPRAVKANTDLLREGAASDQLFVLTAGWACRYKTTREGNRQIVGLLVPGDIANLDAVVFSRPGYGVRILSAANGIALPCDRVMALAERHSGIARLLMRLAMVENGILSQWALGLGRHSAQQRLAHLLCELGARVACDDRDAASFALPLTQEQLADTLGLTPVHVNRMMQQLRGQALIATTGRTVTLLDLPALRRLAEFDPGYLHLGGAADR